MTSGLERIPAELRNRIYELLIPTAVVSARDRQLFLTRRSSKWLGPMKPAEWPGSGLLRVNRMISTEASAVFYGNVDFDFGLAHDKLGEEFLHRIGSQAKHIRSIVIGFPQISRGVDGRCFMYSSCQQQLAMLREHCEGVRYIHTDMMGSDFNSYEPCDKEPYCNYMHIIDKELRRFPKLEEIKVRAWQPTMEEWIKQEVKICGWTIIAETDEKRFDSASYVCGFQLAD